MLPVLMHFLVLVALAMSYKQNAANHTLPHTSTSPSQFVHSVILSLCLKQVNLAMATPSAIPTCLLLLLPTILAMSNSVSKIAPLQTCGCPSQSEINLHYYRHEFPIANDTNRNQEFVVGPKTPFVPFFGNILVHSWSITKRNNANDIIIARMQGTHIGTAIANSWYISSNIAFESGR